VARRVIAAILIFMITGAVVIVWWEYSPSRNVYEVDELITGDPSECGDDLILAVIGDFGNGSHREEDVANMVDGWGVDYVLTVGDNNYPDGKASTIDKNIGQYYQQYIYPYQGSHGAGAEENRFFPALGNHDWNTGSVDAHLDYFTLPGNERYYDVVLGPVHLFVIDSNEEENWLHYTIRLTVPAPNMVMTRRYSGHLPNGGLQLFFQGTSIVTNASITMASSTSSMA